MALVTGSCASVTISAITIDFVYRMIIFYLKNNTFGKLDSNYVAFSTLLFHLYDLALLKYFMGEEIDLKYTTNKGVEQKYDAEVFGEKNKLEKTSEDIEKYKADYEKTILEIKNALEILGITEVEGITNNTSLA